MGWQKETQREQGPVHAEELAYFPTDGGEALKSLSGKTTLNVCLCVYKCMYTSCIHVQTCMYICMYIRIFISPGNQNITGKEKG